MVSIPSYRTHLTSQHCRTLGPIPLSGRDSALFSRIRTVLRLLRWTVDIVAGWVFLGVVVRSLLGAGGKRDEIWVGGTWKSSSSLLICASTYSLVAILCNFAQF
ncbi:hypothetical protein SLEP1_g10378 [Rubroshorea leprosula]|uniref:Uncharacterized protein n=1 Tax=Rubroshorea leprosula TaxID=152421 RepID=A0AAV5I7Y1_9ROSI|nr:hypothetical protein SLEP1_g10378 [Rubroshorea leprosula]